MTIGNRNVIGMTSLSSPLLDSLDLKSVTEASSRADKKRRKDKKNNWTLFGKLKRFRGKAGVESFEKLDFQREKRNRKGGAATFVSIHLMSMQGIVNAKY